MIKGPRATAAAESAAAYVNQARMNGPNLLHRLVFAFPRVKIHGVSGWTSSSPTMAGVAAALRDPAKDWNIAPRKPKIYGPGHSIPSIMVPLNGIRDVEFYVSRRSLELLLSVGCLVIQVNKKKQGFVRVPLNSPLITGEPFEIEVEHPPI